MKTTNQGTKHCWLVKQEPEDYSWDDLVRDGSTQWTGVRNFQARNNLRQMNTGDEVFFYHSGKEKSVVGVAKVSRAAFPDPTAGEPGWIAIEIKPGKRLARPVALADVRANPRLQNLLLVRQSRLSVMPLTKEEFAEILRMGETK